MGLDDISNIGPDFFDDNFALVPPKPVQKQEHACFDLFVKEAPVGEDKGSQVCTVVTESTQGSEKDLLEQMKQQPFKLFKLSKTSQKNVNGELVLKAEKLPITSDVQQMSTAHHSSQTPSKSSKLNEYQQLRAYLSLFKEQLKTLQEKK